MAFSVERQIFSEFKAGLEKKPVVLDEFLAACRTVNVRFDTAIYENRFIIGGNSAPSRATKTRVSGE